MTFALSPLNVLTLPLISCDAATRSSFTAERHRANTASPISVSGMPSSSAATTVHLPVPFWPAASRIRSTTSVAGLVLVPENVAGDFDEIAVEFAVVPFGEDVVHLVVGHAEAAFHQVVDFADQLHVAVLDAVVDHLHEMTGTVLANPIATRIAVGRLGADRLEDRLDRFPRRRAATRHERRTVERAFLAAGNAGADVE